MEMEVGFPGGERVETRFKGNTFAIGKDGENACDEPGLEALDLFFVSIGLCAGKYVMEFCRPRGIPYEETRIRLGTQWDEKKKMHTRVSILIELPRGFPTKYEKAVRRVVDLCSVKRHIMTPPAFAVNVLTAT